MKGHELINSDWESPPEDNSDKNLGTGIVRM